MRSTSQYHALSFVRRNEPRGKGFNYWSITRGQSYSDDCEIGTRLAREYLAFIGNHPTVGNGTLLTCIVHDMIRQGEWSGVHVGFLTDINRTAMITASRAANLEQVA